MAASDVDWIEEDWTGITGTVRLAWTTATLDFVFVASDSEAEVVAGSKCLTK